MCLMHFKDLPSSNKWTEGALQLANFSYPEFERAEINSFVSLPLCCALPTATGSPYFSFVP